MKKTNKTYGVPAPYLVAQFKFFFFTHSSEIKSNSRKQKSDNYIPHMPTFTQENHRRPPPLPQCPSRSQRKLLLFFLKCVIMAVVISLFLFFLGFAAIVLLHFLLMSTAFRRRCHMLSTGAATEASPHSQALLPGVSYNASSFPAISDCAICLDSFREGDLCRNIPVCKHLFHAGCVDRWIRKKPTCPVCRSPVDLGSRIEGGDQWKRLWAVGFEEGTSY